ncbi:Glycine-tRNA ligase [Phytophthora megakarya]|uniref:Glycine-tRNA ligase n=1 Tax=Phytophthora megakarya TaxID=4795 RepID=A0A225X2V3_9STRA|nr:Glycine-tRNA ligase [Phytophthora megakarya]
MFVVPSFEIYGGVGGFYDFGPPACALKSNLLQFWRRHFVFSDKLLEVECTNLMTEVVLKTSGHVDRFTDLMVNATEREKHELHAIMAESYSPEEIHQVFQDYSIKAPATGADLSFPIPFNLMFKCAMNEEHTVGTCRADRDRHMAGPVYRHGPQRLRQDAQRHSKRH